MTATAFKLKAPTVQAIEVTNLLAQAQDVANLVGSQAYQVDVAKGEVTFVLDGADNLVVKTGQVVFVEDKVANARDAAEFYGLYEKA